MESIKHKIGKKLAAKLLNGREECPIRKGHRADACNKNIFAEVTCKGSKERKVCTIDFYPLSCRKIDQEVKCNSLLQFKY